MRFMKEDHIESTIPPVDLPAIILAAGESRRMGGPLKPLLPFRGSTFLETIMATLRAAGLTEILVVLGCRAAEVHAGIDLSKVRVVQNDDWPLGMLSSLRAGIRALPADAPGALVTLVDLPALQVESVRRLLAAWRAAPDRIARATVDGRGGHPVIFPRALFAEILDKDHPDGPRGLLGTHADLVLDVPLDDPGARDDIDTPEDLVGVERRFFRLP
jgi:CTP:molybdopterin cytidylyltransferase MocA